jgi:hypothetical protein
MTEAQPVAVAILNFKIAAVIFLIADFARNRYPFLLIFFVERVGIINP